MKQEAKSILEKKEEQTEMEKQYISIFGSPIDTVFVVMQENQSLEQPSPFKPVFSVTSYDFGSEALVF
ncbi:MAG: hypothetical protein V4498_01175 [candidate division FCPU426 bacterium]